MSQLVVMLFDGLALGSGVIDFVGNYVDGRKRALAAEKVSLDNIKLVSDTLYGKCDARDGVADGLIDDPRACGFNPVRDPMHVNDFHATILHLLGLDHEKLTFKFQGRNFRLTDVAGKVAEKILA